MKRREKEMMKRKERADNERRIEKGKVRERREKKRLKKIERTDDWRGMEREK